MPTTDHFTHSTRRKLLAEFWSPRRRPFNHSCADRLKAQEALSRPQPGEHLPGRTPGPAITAIAGSAPFPPSGSPASPENKTISAAIPFAENKPRKRMMDVWNPVSSPARACKPAENALPPTPPPMPLLPVFVAPHRININESISCRFLQAADRYLKDRISPSFLSFLDRFRSGIGHIGL